MCVLTIENLNEERNLEDIPPMELDLSRDMRFPTMWYVRPAKPQISLGIRAV